jgi:hypothetical protein
MKPIFSSITSPSTNSTSPPSTPNSPPPLPLFITHHSLPLPLPLSTTAPSQPNYPFSSCHFPPPSFYNYLPWPVRTIERIVDLEHYRLLTFPSPESLQDQLKDRINALFIIFGQRLVSKYAAESKQYLSDLDHQRGKFFPPFYTLKAPFHPVNHPSTPNLNHDLF